MDSLSSPAQNIPRKTLTSLDPQRSDYYIVKDGLLYNYYSIKIVPFEVDQKILRFEKYPPIIAEGVVMIKKKLYRVTPEDLLRGLVRTSREIVKVKRDKEKDVENVGNNRSNHPDVDISTANTDASVSASPVVRDAVQHQQQQSAFGLAILEESELVDSSWQEQIGALQDFVSEKEGGEWEISNTL